MPTIAVLITCFNRKEKTLSCLKDIYAQEKEQNVTLDVFIIDGGSSDDTPNNIHKEYPQVNIQVVPGLYRFTNCSINFEYPSNKRLPIFICPAIRNWI